MKGTRRFEATAFLVALAACGRGHGDLVALRDALAGANAIAAATHDAPSCTGVAEAGARAPEACLGAIATWLGSKSGFQYDPPDQAAAATSAIVIARDGHGEWIPAPDAWLFSLTTGSGAGADALRVAVAGRMADATMSVGRPLTSDADARALMRAVASSVPGACDTYARLGADGAVGDGPPERSVDHSPCVQKDLDRATGPREHGRYGTGLWRGAEGALALWRETATALRLGAPRADAAVRPGVLAKVDAIDAALAKVTTKQLPPEQDYSKFMSDVHTKGVRVDAGAR